MPGGPAGGARGSLEELGVGTPEGHVTGSSTSEPQEAQVGRLNKRLPAAQQRHPQSVPTRQQHTCPLSLRVTEPCPLNNHIQSPRSCSKVPLMQKVGVTLGFLWAQRHHTGPLRWGPEGQ